MLFILKKKLLFEKKTCAKMLRVLVKIVILVVICFLKCIVDVLESIRVIFCSFFLMLFFSLISHAFLFSDLSIYICNWFCILKSILSCSALI